MARIGRVVVPNHPHHIIQRGNRRQRVFFSDDDRITYLDYLRLYARPAGVHFWSYCLMDNHVHIIAVPEKEDSFARGFAEAHKRYTRRVNFREKWCGYLWEGRFKSYPLSGPHLRAAIRYIERNPVRAKMVDNAWDYPWSSAAAHVYRRENFLLDENFLISEIPDWKAFLSEADEPGVGNIFQAHETTGRPLGDDVFLEDVEKMTGRKLKKQRPGPKRREETIK